MSRNRRTEKERNRKRALVVRSIIRLAKDGDCIDCGVKYPHYVMDLDHVRGEKRFELSEARRRRSINGIRDEINKCDLVCANCHRERTFSRKQFNRNGKAEKTETEQFTFL